MRALLTNDDGIDSKGLEKLYNFIKNYLGFLDIWIVAPSSDRSATSHAVTLNQELYLKQVSEKKFAIGGGTPVDCVMIAIEELMKDTPPDVIFSGINAGANVGRDVIYSGTVGAAREGTFYNIPSFALSKIYAKSKQDIIWDTDYNMLQQVICNLLKEHSLMTKNTININLPIEDKPIGVKFIEQNRHKMTNLVTRNEMSFNVSTQALPIKCEELSQNYITINPLGSNLTDYSSLEYLRGKYSN